MVCQRGGGRMREQEQRKKAGFGRGVGWDGRPEKSKRVKGLRGGAEAHPGSRSGSMGCGGAGNTLEAKGNQQVARGRRGDNSIRPMESIGFLTPPSPLGVKRLNGKEMSSELVGECVDRRSKVAPSWERWCSMRSRMRRNGRRRRARRRGAIEAEAW